MRIVTPSLTDRNDPNPIAAHLRDEVADRALEKLPKVLTQSRWVR